MTLREFLLKETPEHGCMLVETSYSPYRFFVVERIGKDRGISEDTFLLNGRFYDDYEYVWKECPNWKILYKYDLSSI